MKPQSLATQTLVADPEILRGPSKVSWAECFPWGKGSPRQSAAGELLEGAAMKSYEKNGVEVGRAPP